MRVEPADRSCRLPPCRRPAHRSPRLGCTPLLLHATPRPGLTWKGRRRDFSVRRTGAASNQVRRLPWPAAGELSRGAGGGQASPLVRGAAGYPACMLRALPSVVAWTGRGSATSGALLRAERVYPLSLICAAAKKNVPARGGHILCLTSFSGSRGNRCRFPRLISKAISSFWPFSWPSSL